MRYLGIDYGEKRTGLAYGDELGFAYPLAAVTTGETESRLERIGAVIVERRIEKLVVGYPYNMNGTVGFKAKEVDVFIADLEARFGLEVVRIDERLTSHAVETAWKASGTRKKLRDVRATGEVDSRAAALILQDYLDMIQL